MLAKLQKNLENYIHKDYAYLITCIIYLIMVYSVLLSVGYIFNFVAFVVISAFTFERIRAYSYGFHINTSNLYCILFTIPLFITIQYIAKETPLWISLILCLLAMKDIYHKAPLLFEDVELDKRWYNCKPFSYIKMNRAKMDSVLYDLKWHRKRVLFWLAFSYILVMIFFILEINLYCSYTLWNITLVDLLLFKNRDEK